MRKDEVMIELTKLGLAGWKERAGSKESFYFMKAVGRFRVCILLSNQIRVLIETAGTGSYLIVLKEVNFSFKCLNNSKDVAEVAEAFNHLVDAVNKFELLLINK